MLTSIKERYGKGRERRSELKTFDTIEAATVAVVNSKLYVDREGGFFGIGNAMKQHEFVCDCSNMDDVIVFTTDGKYIITITLKDESKLYNKGDSAQKSYFDGVIALPEFRSLKTTPLVIDSADSYYDGGTLTMTVKDDRIASLSINAAMLADIDFSVA